MNLILTIVQKLEYPALAPFLQSLRQTGFRGQVVFFVCGVSPVTIERLHSAGVRTIPFKYTSIRHRHPILILWPMWRWLFRVMRDDPARRRMARHVFNLFFLRWLLYEDFLQAEGEQFENVLMTDCRDVVFQRDPFAEPNPSGICFYLEPESQTIGSCPVNQQMLRECFDEQMVRQMADCRIACAGTTLGTLEAVKAYLQRMVKESYCVRKMALVPGADQGLHNYLVHRGMLPQAHIIENAAGAVFTMGVAPTTQFRFNSADEVVRSDGGVIPVLHQYDRHPEVRQKLLRKLFSKSNS